MAYSTEWEGIVELYQHTKSLILIAEEYSINWQSYLQPDLEQRSALDHICRAMAIVTGIKENPDDNEVQKIWTKQKGICIEHFSILPTG